MTRMTWDPEAQAIYVYAVDGYDGPVETGCLFEGRLSVNIDRKSDGTLLGIEVLGIESLETLVAERACPICGSTETVELHDGDRQSRAGRAAQKRRPPAIGVVVSLARRPGSSVIWPSAGVTSRDLSSRRLPAVSNPQKEGDPMIRQGDVLLVKVDELPDGATEVARDARGRLVLAEGESTGHAHVIDAPVERATLLTTTENERFLRIVGSAAAPLVHEEHGTIQVAPGFYRQIPQQEWSDADELRQVRD